MVSEVFNFHKVIDLDFQRGWNITENLTSQLVGLHHFTKTMKLINDGGDYGVHLFN